MPIGGSSGGGGGGAPDITIPAAKKTEKDTFAYASGYDPLLLDYLGYEPVYGQRTTDQQKIVDDLKAQIAGTTDKAELKLLKGQLKSATKDMKAIKKDAASDIGFKKRAPTAEEQKQQEFQKQLTGKYQDELLNGNISPEARASLDEYYNNAQDQSQKQIDRTATQMAARRGLNLTDTPAADPYLRATGENAANINAARAQGYLGLREGDLNRAAGYMSYLDAYKQLNQFQNPLSAGSYASNLALGMYAPRFHAAATPASTSGGAGGLAGLGGLLGGAGGLLQGAKGMFGGGGAPAAAAA